MKNTIQLSVTTRLVPTRFDVVQYATAPEIEFYITDWTPSGSARLYIEKPSGAKVYNNCEIDGQSITFTPTTQAFAEVGVNRCQLEIMDGDTVVLSFLMYANVVENIIDSSAIESTDEFTALQEAIEQAEDIDEKITNALTTANAYTDAEVADAIATAKTYTDEELEPIDLRVVDAETKLINIYDSFLTDRSSEDGIIYTSPSGGTPGTRVLVPCLITDNSGMLAMNLPFPPSINPIDNVDLDSLIIYRLRHANGGDIYFSQNGQYIMVNTINVFGDNKISEITRTLTRKIAFASNELSNPIVTGYGINVTFSSPLRVGATNNAPNNSMAIVDCQVNYKAIQGGE